MDAAASALSDPIRRDILRMLRDAPRSAGAIAGAFSVTRPAISRHLRVLREAGLVVDEAQGRERVYRIELAPLAAIEEFIAELRRDPKSEWERRFMALEIEVHRAKRESKKRAAVSASWINSESRRRRDDESDRTSGRQRPGADAPVRRADRGRVAPGRSRTMYEHGEYDRRRRHQTSRVTANT